MVRDSSSGPDGPPVAGLRSSCRLSALHLVRVLYDARRDGPGRFVAMGVVAAPVEVVVDETDFDEDGRHDGIAQDEESRPFLESPVGQIQDGFQIGLDAVPQHEAAGGPGNKRFRAAGPAVVGIEMNGYEEITFSLIGLVADMIKVIVLTKDDGDTISF